MFGSDTVLLTHESRHIEAVTKVADLLHYIKYMQLI